jgi:hypothetical protein
MVSWFISQRGLTMKEITIAPSDFAFLFDESPWGFHQKYVSGIKRPPLILPKIFNVIDGAIKSKYADEDFTKVSKDLPQAILRTSEKWIKSKPIINPKFDVSVQVIGKIDGYLEYPDGSCSIVDFKTSEINEKYAGKYNRQLHSYCYGVTHPDNANCLRLENLTDPGLLVFEPNEFSIDYNCKARLLGNLKWQTFDLDLKWFESFICDEVIPLLAGPEPEPTANDPYWKYLQQFGFEYEQE